MTKFKKTIIILFVLTFMISINAEELSKEWKLKKDKGWLKVYTQTSSKSKIKGFLAIAELDAPMEKIDKILMDIPNHSNWMHQVSFSKLVYDHTVNPIQYNIIKAPFISKRDVIFRGHIKRSPKKVMITFQETKHDSIPPKKEHIRIQFMEGYWELIKKGPKKTKVTYKNIADPGGKIPVWIVNMSSIDMGYKTILGLKKQLENPKYN